MKVQEFLAADRCDVGCRVLLKDGRVFYAWEHGTDNVTLALTVCADGKEDLSLRFVPLEEIEDLTPLESDDWVRATGVQK